jgi:hypothetical protein
LREEGLPVMKKRNPVFEVEVTLKCKLDLEQLVKLLSVAALLSRIVLTIIPYLRL